LSREGLLGNRAVWIAIFCITVLQILFSYQPLFQNVFGTAAIPLGDWLRLLSFTIMVFVIVEIEKVILRRIEKRR
jgi:Ca2+-transporting ATPase